MSFSSKLKQILGISDAEIEKGLELHRENVVIDAMMFTDPQIYTQRVVQRANEMLDAKRPMSEIENDLEKLCLEELMTNPEAQAHYSEAWKRSGVTGGSVTVAWSNDMNIAFDSIASFSIKFERFRGLLVRATRAEDIVTAKRDGKHAMIWNFQNTTTLGGGVDVEKDLEKLDLFYRLGVRIIQLTYNLRNFVGDGCTERYQSGLSYFGQRVVERNEQAGGVN